MIGICILGLPHELTPYSSKLYCIWFCAILLCYIWIQTICNLLHNIFQDLRIQLLHAVDIADCHWTTILESLVDKQRFWRDAQQQLKHAMMPLNTSIGMAYTIQRLQIFMYRPKYSLGDTPIHHLQTRCRLLSSWSFSYTVFTRFQCIMFIIKRVACQPNVDMYKLHQYMHVYVLHSCKAVKFLVVRDHCYFVDSHSEACN